MNQSVKIIAATSIALGLLTLLLRRLQFQQPDPFANPYATASTLTLLGFVLTWAYTAVSVVVMRCIGERLRVPWVEAFALIAGLYVAWGFFGLARFLFP